MTLFLGRWGPGGTKNKTKEHAWGALILLLSTCRVVGNAARQAFNLRTALGNIFPLVHADGEMTVQLCNHQRTGSWFLLFFSPLLQGQWTHLQYLTRNRCMDSLFLGITFLDWCWSVWAGQRWWLGPEAAVLWLESFFQLLPILSQCDDRLAAAHGEEVWKAGMCLTWLLEGEQVFSRYSSEYRH